MTERRRSSDRLKVLAVEDDPVMQRWITMVLKKAGYTVQVAPDAMTGLTLARKTMFDVFVLDLNLPGGGGRGFLERLRKLAGWGAGPVVILSGAIKPSDRRLLAPFDVSTFLEKPIAPERLVEAVQRAVTPATDPEGTAGTP
jgi:CheY-like chemotaxis protein